MLRPHGATVFKVSEDIKWAHINSCIEILLFDVDPKLVIKDKIALCHFHPNYIALYLISKLIREMSFFWNSTFLKSS